MLGFCVVELGAQVRHHSVMKWIEWALIPIKAGFCIFRWDQRVRQVIQCSITNRFNWLRMIEVPDRNGGDS